MDYINQSNELPNENMYFFFTCKVSNCKVKRCPFHIVVQINVSIFAKKNIENMFPTVLSSNHKWRNESRFELMIHISSVIDKQLDNVCVT